MEKKEWEFIKTYIEEILNETSSRLEISSINYIKHYIENDELEMAFEILFTEIIKMKNLPVIDYPKSEKIAKLLKLDKESVFDPYFWKAFIDSISNN